MCTIRDATPDQDFPRIVELVNSVVIEPLTLETLYDSLIHPHEGRITRRTVAVDANDTLMGYGVTNHTPWVPPGQHWIWVITAAPCHRQGIGKALYDDAFAFAVQRGATTFMSEVRDDQPEALAFAQRCGFTVTRHQFQSTLPIATFDETPYTNLFPRLASEGFRFFTMADVPDDEEHHRKLYALNYAIVADMPGSEEYEGFTFEDFQIYVTQSEWYEPKSQIIVALGGEWVGMTALRYLPDTNALDINITGVDRRFRGCNLATALKVLAVRYAKEISAESLLTKNDSENAPILAINQKMGFQPEPGIYLLKREMEDLQ